MEQKKISGTKEWAVAEVNCSLGCPHGCRYCYARYDQVVRRGLTSAESWKTPRDLAGIFASDPPHFSGRVMFPSHHDIVAENLESCLRMLRGLLDAGNSVLVVSKPHLTVIRRLCAEFSRQRQQILLRFTITARDDSLLKFWEPGAPLYAERKECLEYAFAQGFATSVSVEPMLDTGDAVEMVRELLPSVSDTIWLGKMNKIDRRVSVETPDLDAAILKIEEGQTDRRIKELYEELKSIAQVRWKESIKAVVGLACAQEPGLDI